MRTLAPLLAVAFSCAGAHATPAARPAPRPDAGSDAGSFQSLADAFNDSGQPAATRARALDALADLEDPRALALVQQTLDAPSAPPLFVRAALAALARARGAAAIPAIAVKLGSKDAAVSQAAVEALGRIGGPQARAALQKQLDAETRPALRAALERAMAAATP